MNRLVRLPPAPNHTEFPLQNALLRRSSAREFSDIPLPLADLAALLWAAQGVTGPDGSRTAPSAGGIYPLTLSVVAGNVQGLHPGVYRYAPHDHILETIAAGDRRVDLCKAALGQEWICNGAFVIAIAADYAHTIEKYGERGIRYVSMEAGAAGQNIYLQTAALSLGTVFVAAFDDDQVHEILALSPHQYPLALMPVGARSQNVTLT